jgi:hypothetical protein
MACVLLLLCTGLTNAQSTDSRKGWGYVFFGAGVAADDGAFPLFHVGGGGEGLINGGFGAGAEVGYIAPLEESSNGFGIFSANASYHFGGKDPSNKFVPFVTGGYSLGFRSGTAHGGNFGGGVQYWIRERVGLRFEVRDHIFSSDSPHLLSFRFGVTLR